MIELTDEQAQAMAMQPSPLHLLNPRTKETYVLIRQDVYELTCGIIGGAKGGVWDESDEDLIRKKS